MAKHRNMRKRGEVWSFRLAVPADVRPHFGGRTIIEQSLSTGNQRRAQELADGLRAEWWSRIRAARGEDINRHVEAALAIKRDMPNLTGPVYGPDHPYPAELKDTVNAIWAGKGAPFAKRLDDWLAQWAVEPKTKDMGRAVVTAAALRFKTTTGVTDKAVRDWLATDTRSAKTLGRELSALRAYWRYLQAEGWVDTDDPGAFARAKVVRASKAEAKAKREGARRPFPAADVPKLWQKAAELEDLTLSHLIRLGAYTGARIEELCSLTVDDLCKEESIRFLSIADAKTAAGNRRVPVHPAIADLVDELASVARKAAVGKPEGHRAYLLPDLGANKYGDRSNAIGKRFGRMKAEMKYGTAYVFHSLRKTVATLLENAGVAESVAADILGHDKPTMTYGLYSGGSGLRMMAEALGRVAYPVGDAQDSGASNGPHGGV